MWTRGSILIQWGELGDPSKFQPLLLSFQPCRQHHGEKWYNLRGNRSVALFLRARVRLFSEATQSDDRGDLQKQEVLTAECWVTCDELHLKDSGTALEQFKAEREKRESADFNRSDIAHHAWCPSFTYLFTHLFIYFSQMGSDKVNKRHCWDTIFVARQKTLLTAIESIYPHQQSDGGVQIAEGGGVGGDNVVWEKGGMWVGRGREVTPLSLMTRPKWLKSGRVCEAARWWRDTSGGFTDTETLLQPLGAPAASAPITALHPNFRLEPAKSQQSSAEERRRDLSGL